jgi:predicted ATP-binding protein involved in virulence
MTYWHIQLHPNDKNWGREKELLEELSLIGLGVINNNYDNSQNKQFINDMKIDDIVLIRNGANVIALVQVIGESEDIGSNNYSRLDWFRYRRRVKVLDYANKFSAFPQPRGALKKSINKQTSSYQYIHNWYLQILNRDFNKEDKKEGTYKIEEIYIQDYKMFQNLKIDLTSDDKNPLPIVVIAGKNGTGKTTLLEYLASLKIKNSDYVKIFKIRKLEDDDLIDYEYNSDFIEEPLIIKDKIKGIKSKKDEYKNHIIYLPIGIEKQSDIENAIVDYYINLGEFKDLRPSEIIIELQKFINTIFSKDFDLTFTISRVDIRTRQVFFKNSNGIEISINELSTGEKTLLSKVLYLYFRDIKNQIILIDEPELSLHPAWQNRVLKLYENFAEKNNCQIIIATHSPHIIGSAKSEYVRLLTKDGVVDNFSHTYGAKFSQILTDIMGVRDLRTPEINDKFVAIKDMIVENKFDTQEFKEKWQELENILGKNYFDLKLLKLEIASRRKDVQNR